MISDSVDDSELLDLERDLGLIAPRMTAKLPGLVSKTSLEMKKVMRDDMAKSKHFSQIAQTINYDTSFVDAPDMYVVEGEIGPDKEVRVSQGMNPAPLAHIAYYGGANGGGNTVRDPEDAMLEIAPDFFAYAELLAAEVEL